MNPYADDIDDPPSLGAHLRRTALVMRMRPKTLMLNSLWSCAGVSSAAPVTDQRIDQDVDSLNPRSPVGPSGRLIASHVKIENITVAVTWRCSTCSDPRKRPTSEAQPLSRCLRRTITNTCKVVDIMTPLY
jgi:hypothetical protein